MYFLKFSSTKKILQNKALRIAHNFTRDEQYESRARFVAINVMLSYNNSHIIILDNLGPVKSALKGVFQLALFPPCF